MPTYDYKCSECGHQFDVFHSMAEPAWKVCPECKQKSLVRLFGSGAGIIFKGSGFYETDYKRKGKSTSEKKVEKPCENSCSCPKRKECPVGDS